MHSTDIHTCKSIYIYKDTHTNCYCWYLSLFSNVTGNRRWQIPRIFSLLSVTMELGWLRYWMRCFGFTYRTRNGKKGKETWMLCFWNIVAKCHPTFSLPPTLPHFVHEYVVNIESWNYILQLLTLCLVGVIKEKISGYFYTVHIFIQSYKPTANREIVLMISITFDTNQSSTTHFICMRSSLHWLQFRLTN